MVKKKSKDTVTYKIKFALPATQDQAHDQIKLRIYKSYFGEWFHHFYIILEIIFSGTLRKNTFSTTETEKYW